MGRKLSVIIILALYCSITFVKGADGQKPQLPTDLPPGLNTDSLLTPFYQLEPADEPVEKPSFSLRSVPSKTDGNNSSPSHHVLEYLISPSGSQSRTIVAQTQIIDITKNVPIPEPDSDKLENAGEIKDFTLSPTPKVEDFQEIGTDSNPVENVMSMKDDGLNTVSDIKEPSMHQPLLERISGVKGPLPEVPLQKREDLKEIPVKLLETVRTANFKEAVTVGVPVLFVRNSQPSSNPTYLPIAHVPSPPPQPPNWDDFPTQKGESLSNPATLPGEKLNNVTIEKTILPTAKVPELKRIGSETVLNPVEKIENAEETTVSKAQLPEHPASDFKDTVAGNPLEKLESVDETVIDKEIVPAQENDKTDAGNASDAINFDGMKDNVLSSPPVKLENNTYPKLDIVYNAFTQSIMGDRKEYFKQAISRLDKDDLDILHEILLNAFSAKGVVPPATGNVIDLKDAVHELATMGGGVDYKKEALIEIEQAFNSGKNTSEIKIPVSQGPIENISDIKGTVGNPVGSGTNDTNVSVSPPVKIMDAINKTTGNKSSIIFINGRKNIPRWPRWEIPQPRQIGKPYRQTQNVNWGRWKRSVYGIGTTSQELHNFLPPAGLRIPMKTAFRQINSAAPPDPYPKSKESLSLPILTINEVATDKVIQSFEIMNDIKEGLQYILQTRNDWTFGIHGTGTTGCHAVLDNLIESGDKVVLVLVNGYWGELMANMSERLGGQVVRYKKPPGTVFTLNEIETALRVHRPDLVAVVQGESSTAVNQPLEGIGDLCAKNGALLVADVVAVAGIQPVLMDKNKIDAVFTSTHKGLGAVAGLAPVSLSSRAVQKIRNRLTPPRAYQTDFTLQRQIWNTNEPDRTRFQSLSLPLLYAIRESLATIVEERMENTFKRHALTTEHLNRGLAALGLEHFVENPKDRLIGITAVKPPIGKDPKKIARYMFKNYNIDISTGLGPTEGQVLRFATFASNADTLRISNLLRALKNALNSRETSVSY